MEADVKIGTDSGDIYAERRMVNGKAVVDYSFPDGYEIEE